MKAGCCWSRWRRGAEEAGAGDAAAGGERSAGRSVADDAEVAGWERSTDAAWSCSPEQLDGATCRSAGGIVERRRASAKDATSEAAVKRRAMLPGAQVESSPKRDAPEAVDGDEEARRAARG